MTPGFVVYEGPSRLDGAPIVAIVTRDSLNTKTGDMAQAWVLRADVPPHEAIRDGRDRSICGACVHRSGSRFGRSCYVVVHYAPLNVWRAFTAGHYPALTPEETSRELVGQQLRLAAYGDPAAVPFAIWRALLLHLTRAIAYTHQWRTCDQRFRLICMASVDSEAEADQAHTLGWRTFRARLEGERLRPDEIVCPASEEAGHRLSCQACGLCVGVRRAGARSIAIYAHGQRVKWFAAAKAAASGGDVWV